MTTIIDRETAARGEANARNATLLESMETVRRAIPRNSGAIRRRGAIRRNSLTPHLRPSARDRELDAQVEQRVARGEDLRDAPRGGGGARPPRGRDRAAAQPDRPGQPRPRRAADAQPAAAPGDDPVPAARREDDRIRRRPVLRRGNGQRLRQRLRQRNVVRRDPLLLRGRAGGAGARAGAPAPAPAPAPVAAPHKRSIEATIPPLKLNLGGGAAGGGSDRLATARDGATGLSVGSSLPADLDSLDAFTFRTDEGPVTVRARARAARWRT